MLQVFNDFVDQQFDFLDEFIQKPFMFFEITRQGPKMKPGDPKSKKITPGSAIQPKWNQKGTRIQPKWSKGVPKANKIEPTECQNEPKLLQIQALELCTLVPFTLVRPFRFFNEMGETRRSRQAFKVRQKPQLCLTRQNYFVYNFL